MRIIKWIIVGLIFTTPVILNLVMWNINIPIRSLYVIILSYYLGFQFAYYGLHFGKWFDSKLK